MLCTGCMGGKLRRETVDRRRRHPVLLPSCITVKFSTEHVIWEPLSQHSAPPPPAAPYVRNTPSPGQFRLGLFPLSMRAKTSRNSTPLPDGSVDRGALEKLFGCGARALGKTFHAETSYRTERPQQDGSSEPVTPSVRCAQYHVPRKERSTSVFHLHNSLLSTSPRRAPRYLSMCNIHPLPSSTTRAFSWSANLTVPR